MYISLSSFLLHSSSSPLELSHLSQFALPVYSSSSLHSQALLMVLLPFFLWWFQSMFFISSVRVANVLFLCCTPNHLLTSLLINFFTSIHPSLIHLTLIPSIPYSSHSYSVHHLFTSLLINLFTSIHPSLIIHSRLVTSSYVHLWDPVFLLVSHQHTLIPLFCSYYTLCCKV